MNYKIYLYAITLFLSIFALSGVNYTGVFKINHKIEAKALIMLLSMALSYLVTNFIYDIINL